MLKEIEWRWDDNWIVLADKGAVQFEWYPVRPKWMPPPIPDDDPSGEIVERELEPA